MQTKEMVTLEQREATVLSDVLTWAAADNDFDPVEAAGTMDPTVTVDALPEAIETLDSENALDLSLVSRDEVGFLMEQFATELKERAWDLDDTQTVFAFYEETFQTIESELTPNNAQQNSL